MDQCFPAARAAAWRLPSVDLTFGRLPRLMGIVNVTPDSFSDGGNYFDAGRAVAHALLLAEQGADLLDIGGESTRPYSTPVAVEEELRRVIPVVREVARQTNVPVSIDTSKAAVAEQAVEAGAEIINDVTGLEGDPRMLPLAVAAKVGVCAMHMQGTPQTMQDAPGYRDVVAEVAEYLRLRRERLLQAGVELPRICLDPGIGFGKTHQHNLQLLAGSGTFLSLGCPILVGHSRKGFIGRVLGDADRPRDAGTVGAALAVARQGIQVLRVHDVQCVKDALELFDAAGGLDGAARMLTDAKPAGTMNRAAPPASEPNS